MASNIWEALQASQGAPMPIGGYTNQLNQLIQAKTGKAPVESTGPAKTNLAEQQATLMGQADASRVMGQADLAQQGFKQELTGLQKQASQQMQQQAQGFNEKQAMMRREADKLYQQTADKLNELDAHRKVMAFEQMGALYSLSNDSYLFNLQKEASKRRLDNALQEAEALQYAMYSDQIDLLKTDLKFKRMLDLQNDAALREIADMDINTAIMVFEDKQKAETTSRVYDSMAKATAKLLPDAMGVIPGDKNPTAQSDSGYSGQYLGLGAPVEPWTTQFDWTP